MHGFYARQLYIQFVYTFFFWHTLSAPSSSHRRRNFNASLAVYWRQYALCTFTHVDLWTCNSLPNIIFVGYNVPWWITRFNLFVTNASLRITPSCMWPLVTFCMTRLRNAQHLDQHILSFKFFCQIYGTHNNTNLMIDLQKCDIRSKFNP